MLGIIVKGILIGILVSAPMGPVGILCVHRTLTRGRHHGFVSGMGAAVSDVLYALVTLLGISLITDFLESHKMAFQLGGSIVLIVFGYMVFNTNPLKVVNPGSEPAETRYTKDFISAFLLTVSNVIIIFVFLTLYARFGFNPVDRGIGFLILGLISIAMGAVAWWFFITTLVSYLCKHFSRSSLVLLNRSVGVILILVGVVGMFTGFS